MMSGPQSGAKSKAGVLVAVILVVAFVSLAVTRGGVLTSSNGLETEESLRIPPDNPVCASINPKERKNCGYPGIGSIGCTGKGCCFDTSVRDVPWCFYPTYGDDVCPKTNPKKRMSRGYPGITQRQCQLEGNCWDDSVAGVPWCYTPTNPVNLGKKTPRRDQESAVQGEKAKKNGVFWEKSVQKTEHAVGDKRLKKLADKQIFAKQDGSIIVYNAYGRQVGSVSEISKTIRDRWGHVIGSYNYGNVYNQKRMRIGTVDKEGAIYRNGFQMGQVEGMDIVSFRSGTKVGSVRDRWASKVAIGSAALVLQLV